jgi:hypothetical protein
LGHTAAARGERERKPDRGQPGGDYIARRVGWRPEAGTHPPSCWSGALGWLWLPNTSQTCGPCYFAVLYFLFLSLYGLLVVMCRPCPLSQLHNCLAVFGCKSQIRIPCSIWLIKFRISPSQQKKSSDISTRNKLHKEY